MSQPNSTAAAAAAAAANTQAEAIDAVALFENLDQCELAIPDEVVSYYLERSGCECPDPRLKRLVALATQKFIHEITTDAKRISDFRTTSDTNTTLKMDDLAAALEEKGITVVKPAYFAEKEKEQEQGS